MESKKRIILHVDINSFYPSVEVRENPAIKGKPVIVGADPKGGAARGVVLSCTYEARKFGVHSGQPISQAYKLAPDAIYLPPDFKLYGEVSKQIMNVLRKFTDKFEQVSIDEAFLDVSDIVSTFEEARELALKIKKAVKDEGLTCSVGVAPNKSSAKIASDFQKPDGLTVVSDEKLKDFLAPLSVSAISGVGKKTTVFLESMGIKTIGDLQKSSGEKLMKLFGKTGVWLWGVVNGLERIEVKERPMRSLSVEHTFEEDVSDKSEVLAKLNNLVERLYKRVSASKVSFKNVGIKVRFAQFQTFSREKTLPASTTSKHAIFLEARTLFREFEKDERKFRLIGVSVSEFEPLEEKSQAESLESWV